MIRTHCLTLPRTTTLPLLLLLPPLPQMVLSDRRRVSISSPDLRGSSNPLELHVWQSPFILFGGTRATILGSISLNDFTFFGI